MDSVLKNYGQVWFLPGPNLPQEYIPNMGIFRLTFCDGQARAILVARLVKSDISGPIYYHPLIDWRDHTTVELRYNGGKASEADNCLFRLINCRQRRAWLKYPVAWQPEQRAMLSIYLEVWTEQYEIFR